MIIKASTGAAVLLFTQLMTLSSTEIAERQPIANGISFYVGTYTRGESKGIYRYRLQPDGKLKSFGLAAESENPSFLAKSPDGKYLLAANENRDDAGGGGTITSFEINGEALSLIDKKPSGGASPCFVTIDKSGYVFAANYSSGNVGLLRLGSSGMLDGPLHVLQHEGEGSHARQKGPHAHSVWFEPKGNTIISVDLGTNELWFSTLDKDNEKLVPTAPYKLAMAPGAGPRHMAFHPKGSWVYVVNELSSTVTQIKKNNVGHYEIAGSISTLPTGYEETSSCADIHISDDGKFLYASNRGHNSIAVYQVNSSNGSLTLVGHEGVRGDWPRNFTLSPGGDYLLVANQKSNNIISFKRDKKSGKLEFVSEIEAPSPVCLLF
ncbi:lactonase family protein [Imperialibacter roseus]|uniref:Lactonase family protein n=1 Tax=Imperialibacter roseus TaxID=1324217 RepID=A0ABZ0IUK9_9BACT|nr:lactonase family protein [Imperialibacter roseus]WOK08446.1 lactonase family protein [Imperialibacter roseus]